MSAALLDYLESQRGVAFKRLYEQPSTVLAVLRRMLPHLGIFVSGSIVVLALMGNCSKDDRHGDVVHARAVF